MPPEKSSSDCLPSGSPTSSSKKAKHVVGLGRIYKHVVGLGRIYEDSSKNTLFRVTHLPDSSKGGEIVVCLNEHPNVLMRRSSLNKFKGQQLVRRIEEEMGITILNIELCATSGNKPSHRVNAALAMLRYSQMAIQLVTELGFQSSRIFVVFDSNIAFNPLLPISNYNFNHVEEIKIPKESSSDCSPSGQSTTSVKKAKHVASLG